MASVRRTKIYQLVPSGVTSSGVPVWVNKPKTSATCWEEGMPPGGAPDPGNEAAGIGSGFPALSKPHLQFKKLKSASIPDLFWFHRTMWLLSDRAKTTMAAVDATAFEFCEAETLWSDGSQGPPLWIADVVRFLDAVDEAKSKVQ